MLEQQAQSSNKNIIFTGGDDFTGFKEIAHNLMMYNELIGGYGAYEVKFSGTKNSGLSFGGNQRDMSTRPDAVQDFIKILSNATDSKGNLIIKKSELANILGNNNINITQKKHLS